MNITALIFESQSRIREYFERVGSVALFVLIIMWSFALPSSLSLTFVVCGATYRCLSFTRALHYYTPMYRYRHRTYKLYYR